MKLIHNLLWSLPWSAWECKILLSMEIASLSDVRHSAEHEMGTCGQEGLDLQLPIRDWSCGTSSHAIYSHFFQQIHQSRSNSCIITLHVFIVNLKEDELRAHHLKPSIPAALQVVDISDVSMLFNYISLIWRCLTTYLLLSLLLIILTWQMLNAILLIELKQLDAIYCPIIELTPQLLAPKTLFRHTMVPLSSWIEQLGIENQPLHTFSHNTTDLVWSCRLLILVIGEASVVEVACYEFKCLEIVEQTTFTLGTYNVGLYFPHL